MNLVSMMRRMAENNAWANDRLHRAVAALTDAEYKATRTSFFPSIHLTFTHILIVDLFYIDALTRGGVGAATWDDEPRLEALGFPAIHVEQSAADRRLVDYVASLPDDAALDAHVTMERARGPQIETVAATLAHLFQHQVHHRGQAHAMLAGTRVKPPQLDEYFMAADLPSREAELRALGLPIG